jgi:hypothetical protein
MLVAMAGNLIKMRPEAIPPRAKRMGLWAPRTMIFEVASIVLVYVMIRLRAI